MHKYNSLPSPICFELDVTPRALKNYCIIDMLTCCTGREEQRSCIVQVVRTQSYVHRTTLKPTPQERGGKSSIKMPSWSSSMLTIAVKLETPVGRHLQSPTTAAVEHSCCCYRVTCAPCVFPISDFCGGPGLGVFQPLLSVKRKEQRTKTRPDDHRVL